MLIAAMLLLLQVTPEWYKICEAAGLLLAPDSPALAKNYGKPGTEGLPPPPWFDADGNEISYIGACPERSSPGTVPPKPPGGLNVL